MGLYNMIFGRNAMGPAILATLGLTTGDMGRYRDCFVANGEIAVYTRNGGGNREYYMPDFSEHPNFIRDEDDDFDSTYATIYFSFPEEYTEILTKIDSGEPFDPDKRWLDMLEISKKDMERRIQTFEKE